MIARKCINGHIQLVFDGDATYCDNAQVNDFVIALLGDVDGAVSASSRAWTPC
jgi:hypothetical protein